MLTIGCHLSIAKGFAAAARDAASIGANTFQFFTRNPRGGKAKALDPSDLQAFNAACANRDVHCILAHAPYTLNPASAKPETREFARMTLMDDLVRMEQIMPVVRVLPYRPGNMLRVTALGQKEIGSPDPLRHYGYTAGSMYTDIRSLKKMLLCVMNGGEHLLSKKWTDQMTTRHAEYGSLSPSLSYGLGTLIVQDKSISGGRVLGHQGFAYGCADGAFWDEESGWIMIILNGGCSEARTGRLGICNRDMLRYAFGKELPQWVMLKQ